MTARETKRVVRAFGASAGIYGFGENVDQAVEEAARVIVEVQETLTRFDPGSELSRLNADPRGTVPISPLMLAFVESVRYAGELSEGLVDATCLPQVERAGYTDSLCAAGDPSAPPESSAAAPRQVPAGSRAGWRDLVLSKEDSAVSRPPGLRLDPGGIAKGLAADLASEKLRRLEWFAVECLGELRFGGRSGQPRQVFVADPDLGRPPIAELRAASGAAATSGTTRRSWFRDGKRSHHLIDPRTGEPADTGVIQVTALAESALEAEVRAKAALLAGPGGAAGELTHGGVICLEGGAVRVLEPFVGTGADR